MSVIDFLERFGQDAELRYATTEVVDEALRDAGVATAVRTAILDKDQHALEALLGADTNVCCMVHKEDEEEEEEEEEEDDEEKEGDEEEARSRRRVGHAA